MKRLAFKMYLKEGFKEEYRKRHNELWPEVADLLKKAGVSNYSIFLDEGTNTLFAVQTITSD
ncbi:MAG: L-rhamnose mutarotase, partial [Bacteroidales bacterium]|nr:L-rhamnose mutarotase [Bacteroidales bacterium]